MPSLEISSCSAVVVASEQLVSVGTWNPTAEAVKEKCRRGKGFVLVEKEKEKETG